MANDEIGRLLNEIGQILAGDADYPIEGTLLYAEVDDMWAAPAIFKDRGNHVLYRDSMDALTWPLIWLWEEQDPGKRWAEIEYLIKDGRFEVTYTYPDEIDLDEDPMDRRNRIVARYFGDKPIVYPGLPTEADVQRFEL